MYFNPRSREGSDTGLIKQVPVLIYFNPRSREGSDCQAENNHCVYSISIRAPAKGATVICFHFGFHCYLFQSALPRRERLYYVCLSYGWLIFQSALPRRERQDDMMKLERATVFQSALPRRERRQKGRGLLYNNYISIRAPAKGATIHIVFRCDKSSYISIRAPAKGATPIPFLPYSGSTISIRAPAKGATMRHWQESFPSAFQSALPRRERPAVKPE